MIFYKVMRLFLLALMFVVALTGCGGSSSTAGEDTLITAEEDRVKPSQPANLAARSISNTRVAIAWSASTDNVAVAGYRLFRDGAWVATVSDTRYEDYGLSDNTLYHYAVAAYDSAGNVSEASEILTPAAQVGDSEAPRAPTGLRASDIGGSSIALAWSASMDNTAVIGYRLFRDGKEIAFTVSTSYEDQGLRANTPYQYAVVAYDAAGNVSGRSSVLTTTIVNSLATKSDLEYIGGFKIPNTTYGVSRAGYSAGKIALGANRDTIFLVGHARHHAIAEFSIPALVNSTDTGKFNIATNIQPFSPVLNRPTSGNPQKMDSIGGMALINGSLVVNAYEYYDGLQDNTHTTLVLHEPNDLASSSVSGFDGYDAKSHASGWISPVPSEWQASLKGSYITGDSSGKPITGRSSVGPSAFAFYPEKTITSPHSPSTVITTKLFDYNLANPIGYTSGTTADYLYNTSLTNKLWSHLSTAAYGFIIPSTRSYFVIGSSGGHESGVGYKITTDQGRLCGGYCAYQAADNYSYYWIFDLDDLAKVASGEVKIEDVMPYEYGKFEIPMIDTGPKQVIGGTFDPTSQTLYLVVNKTGYEPIPVILAYKIKGL